MEPLTICILHYEPECNVYAKAWPTSFTEETILINSSLIESVKLVEESFWYLHITEQVSGLFWKTTTRIDERKLWCKETFYQLTMCSGEKFLTQNTGFSELINLNGREVINGN